MTGTIEIYQPAKGDGLFFAKRKKGDIKGKGPSSVEALCDLLEKEEAAGVLAAAVKEEREV